MNPEWLESVARCQLHYNLPGDYLFKNKNKEEDRNQETVKLSGLESGVLNANPLVCHRWVADD